MPLTTQDVAEIIRGRLGDPPVEELPAEQVNRAIEAALREFSRYRPRFEQVSITLEKGRADYVLPEGVSDVAEVWVIPTGVVFGEALDPLAMMMEGLTEDILDKLRRAGIQPMTDFIWEWDVIPGNPPTLRVYPTPNTGPFTALVLMERNVTQVEELEDREVELIVEYAMGDCMEYVGRKRSKTVRQVPTATGKLVLDDGKDLREEGCLLKKSFHKKLGVMVTTAVVG